MRPRRGCQKKQNREYLPEQRAYPLCLDEYRDASIKRLGAKKTAGKLALSGGGTGRKPALHSLPEL